MSQYLSTVDGELQFTYTLNIEIRERLTKKFMIKYILKRSIKTELEKLNQEIDYKITHGIAYKKEARRHKFLCYELYKLCAKEKGGLVQKFSRVIAMFLF